MKAGGDDNRVLSATSAVSATTAIQQPITTGSGETGNLWYNPLMVDYNELKKKFRPFKGELPAYFATGEAAEKLLAGRLSSTAP